MKFGAVPVTDAMGATAVHSIRQGEFVLKKGTRIGPNEIAAQALASSRALGRPKPSPVIAPSSPPRQTGNSTFPLRGVTHRRAAKLQRSSSAPMPGRSA